MSSLSPQDANGLRHRTLRVYDRQAALQSTSEAVPGLEHPLVWRPSGNLIVGTQRFGFEGGGAGKEGRHDVVFFERNGLRHGEFSLRVEHLGGKAEGVDSGYQRRWGYQVRELDWNADSNVLSVWIEGDDGDIGTTSFCNVCTLMSISISPTLEHGKLSLASPDADPGLMVRLINIAGISNMRLPLLFRLRDNLVALHPSLGIQKFPFIYC